MIHQREVRLGDKVRLKSGSPDLTVVALWDDTITVQWENEGKSEIWTRPASSFALANDEKSKFQKPEIQFQPLTLDCRLRDILDAINEYRRANFFQLEGPIMRRADNPDLDTRPHPHTSQLSM